jgi:hypothetical protein
MRFSNARLGPAIFSQIEYRTQEAYRRANYHAQKGMACDYAQNSVASGG